MCKSIVKACVRYNDRLYTGFDHGECFKKLNEDNTIPVHSDIEQGFVDSDGNFVDRKQATIIAKESGQLAYETDKKTLISEDLHLDWLNKQAQRIAELEEQLANSIRPKFPRQEHICGFAFGEIREYIVVAYLDNNITLCENIETSELEWCDNNFLVRTFEEAQAKLKELGEKK